MLYLLDTNALSEVDKPKPNKGLMEWFSQSLVSELHISCIAVGELYKGMELVTDTLKRQQLERRTDEIVEEFNDRILNIDTETMTIWSKLVANSIKKGKTSPSIESLIAAQCVQNRLVLVTRNVDDFKHFSGLEILCPWSTD